MNEVTRILAAIEDGADPRTAEELLPLVYEELRRLAASKMARQPPGQTIQATALVHEAYLKLTGPQAGQWNGRKHFYRAAAEAMRHILIDRARKKSRLRREGCDKRVPLFETEIGAPAPDDEETLIALNEAIERLEKKDPLKVQVVKLKFFIGLTDHEIGEQLAISERTVNRYWAYSKAWLFEQISRDS